MFKLIKTIILSRLTKPKEDEEVLRKRSICAKCELNSKNLEKIELKKRIIKWLSDLYSWIAFKNEEDNLHNCGFCGCSVFYKTLYEDTCPHPKGDKWKIN